MNNAGIRPLQLSQILAFQSFCDFCDFHSRQAFQAEFDDQRVEVAHLREFTASGSPITRSENR
ncbi:hypothetical protein GCM10009000_103960 [Halobacterium noricense]